LGYKSVVLWAMNYQVLDRFFCCTAELASRGWVDGWVYGMAVSGR
jgi:hypothetical protein